MDQVPDSPAGKEAAEMIPLLGARALGSRMQRPGKGAGIPPLRGTGSLCPELLGEVNGRAGTAAARATTAGAAAEKATAVAVRSAAEATGGEASKGATKSPK